MAEPLEVMIIEGEPGVSRSNVIWERHWPMRGGKPREGHPCFGNPEPLTFAPVDPGKRDDPLSLFRARGYGAASCFPEGDGITFDIPDGQTLDHAVRDVEECFGFNVSRVRRQP